MLNKLKKFRDFFSEKTKMYIYVGTTLLVLIASCLLPLAFGGSLSENLSQPGEKAAMFVKYINKDKSIRYKVNPKPSNNQIKFCESVFDELAGYCILDNNSRKTVSEGYEFISLSNGEINMELCRMWLQDQGDWTNWMDVYMDVDTGFVYYIYVSSICVYNNQKYVSSIDSELNSKNIASMIAKETGYDLRMVNWSGKAEDTATAFTSMNGDALIWNINCSYYPSSILDIKISVA